MLFIFCFQSAQNRTRFFLSRLFDNHRLKTPLQCSIFFKIFAVFVKGRSADALYLAARERRFEHICSIKRTLRTAGTDERMQLVNKKDNILRFAYFFDYAFNALFKLTAVFCTGDNGRKVEGDDTLAEQRARHLLGNDCRRQALYDSCFADTRLAYQHGIVFSTAR